MGTLEVQPAGSRLLHCYARGVQFQYDTPGLILGLPGLRSANLVTARRQPERWCLVVDPGLPVTQENALALVGFARLLAEAVGCRRLRLLRHVERADSGEAYDPADWLKI